MVLTTGVKKLRAFLGLHKISRRQLARDIGVSLTTVLDWLKGSKSPTDGHREALELWTKGTVLAVDWQTAKERKAAAAKPFESAKGAA